MLAKLLILFIVVPLVELTLLLYVGSKAGVPFTLALVIITGVAGALLARQQGWSAYRRSQQELSAGRLPTDPLIDAVMIFLAGALLLTPGILTDVLGFTLLVAPCRGLYRRWLIRRLKARFGDVPWNVGPSEPDMRRDRIIDSYVVDESDREDGS